MNEYIKILIKLLGLMTKEIALIAANLAYINIIKTKTSSERAIVLKEISSKLDKKIDTIDRLIKEATND